MQTAYSLFPLMFGGRGLGLALGAVVGLTVLAVPTFGAAGFVESLSESRQVELGLDRLTPVQRAGLNAAIQTYVSRTQAEVRHRAVVRDLGKQRGSVEPEIRLQSRIAGPFRGWTGHTIFRLENGQIWEQVDSDVYYRNFPDGVEVAIIPGSFGTFRLRLSDGATVVVRRR